MPNISKLILNVQIRIDVIGICISFRLYTEFVAQVDLEFVEIRKIFSCINTVKN